ncbi:MAG: type Z 30S ribosomal protein S14 [Pseudomonadota bacterium]|nr:type Z 30S ribosomal protein S14 [Pseudomonadota bacterium]MBU1398765.1 type Z 30S ribosomal protein S14 [Pseudomonadota bacterium]MBU1570998.1 type Z 30S ribosomal protein S14 [Pseudomonadota bacterium]
MAKLSLRNKALRKPKFSVRGYNRCPICGRPRAYIRKFGICRICFRNLASSGKLPGVIKSSW